MIQTGIAEDVGAILRGISVGYPLPETERVGEEFVHEVAVPGHLHEFFTIMNHKAIIVSKELKRECNPIRQRLPVIIDDSGLRQGVHGFR